MFVVLLDVFGIEVQLVYIFQEECINIIYYEGVKIFDSYCLGDVDVGLKVMVVGLELEYGGGSFVGY